MPKYIWGIQKPCNILIKEYLEKFLDSILPELNLEQADIKVISELAIEELPELIADPSLYFFLYKKELKLNLNTIFEQYCDNPEECTNRVLESLENSIETSEIKQVNKKFETEIDELEEFMRNEGLNEEQINFLLKYFDDIEEFKRALNVFEGDIEELIQKIKGVYND